MAGLSFLVALAPAIFAEFYVRHEVIAETVSQTAFNITAHEPLFRLGIASNLFVFAIDIALITALFFVLRAISEYLALLALVAGIVETTILVVVTLTDLGVLHVLGGAGQLQTLEDEPTQNLLGLLVGAHPLIYNVGLIFAGLRSTVFCYLFFKSGYVPRTLAILGIFASFLMGTAAFSFIVSPELHSYISVAVYGGPIFIFELTFGFWLLIKGMREPATEG